MKPGTGHYWLAGLCVVAGVVAHILAPDGPIALSLIIAGTGVLARSSAVNASEASSRRAEAERLAAELERLKRSGGGGA